jgi:ectoine hydroxylase-related dioxygenase (phytanoyl-CoA dioxygenase family)
MLRRVDDLNYVHGGPAPAASHALERDGHCILRGVLSPAQVAALRAEIDDVYRRIAPEMRASALTPEIGAMYRYQMFNHSALCQQAMARAEILDVLEPLLGEGLHAISCTSWRNPPGEALTPHGLQGHVDGGPHVPRAPGTPWPDHIPYPVFVVGCHVYLQDVALDDGPTACIPGSHRSGLVPPFERRWEFDLAYEGRMAVHHVVAAGDVDLRVSDVWHRRWPPSVRSRGRFFLQVNYARRDIAQRVLPTDVVNHASPAAQQRARTPRERALIGLHPQAYFDA